MRFLLLIIGVIVIGTLAAFGAAYVLQRADAAPACQVINGETVCVK